MRFLSDEWAETAQTALREDDAFMRLAGRADLTLTIVPEAAPGWAHPVTVVVTAGDVELSTQRLGRSQAVGRAAYETWLSMLRHELHPRRAVVTRRLRGRGATAILTHYRLIDRALDVFRGIPVDA